MLLHPTAKEQKELQDVQEKYFTEVSRLRDAYLGEIDPEKKKQEKDAYLKAVVTLSKAMDEINEKLQAKRFAKIRDDKEAIFKDAQEQIDEFLPWAHKELLSNMTEEDLKTTKWGCIKDGKKYLNAVYAAKCLKDELHLHFDALKGDEDGTQKLWALLTTGIENSPLTDNEPIKNHVLRFRRTPLGDLKTYGLMNDKATTQLIQDEDIFTREPNGQVTLKWAVDQSPRTAKKPIPVYMSLTMDKQEMQMTKKLNAFDNAVYNAIATRFYYWRQSNEETPLYITPQEIYKTMNGKQSRDRSATPSTKQIEKICKSMDKMRFTRLYMDISGEIRAKYIMFNDERVTDGRIDTYLLECDKVEFKTEKGTIVQGYRIKEEPILYTYNAAKKHILYVPFELLDTSKTVQNGDFVAEFRNYLLQQIENLKNGKRNSSKIKIDSIYEATNIETPEMRTYEGDYKDRRTYMATLRKAKKADRDKIEGILEAWKQKEWIKDYFPLTKKGELAEKNQAVTAYDIKL